MNRLSKKEVCDLILTIPDKFMHKETTSHQMKMDLVDKFYNTSGDILEVGCHKGQTSLILSHLFRNVYAMNINPPSKDFPQRENVHYEQMDSYKNKWKFDKWKDVEVVMIDAIHEYSQVKQDTKNTLKLPKVKYIIFDDYGHPGFPGVKKYVDKFVEENNLKLIPLGLQKGMKFVGTIGRQSFPIEFMDSEGVLVEL